MKKFIFTLVAFAIWTGTSGQNNSCQDLFISEMIEGNAPNRALEIFNPSDVDIDLSDFSIRLFQNGQLTPLTIPLSGTLPPKSTFVIAHPAAKNEIKTKADMLDPQLTFDGNDAIVLEKTGGTQVDKIGEIGVNPGNGGWFVPPNGSTKEQTLRRKQPIDKGETNWNQGKNQWTVHPKDSVSNLKQHENTCNCAFSIANGTSWYVNGAPEFWFYQQDVYVFRLANKQAYTGQLDTNVVDSITYKSTTGLKYNVVSFNLNSTTLDRELVKAQIRNEALFEIEFPPVTKFPLKNRTQEDWMFSNDVVKIVFRDSDPPPATVQFIENKHNLILIHEPNPLLPKGGNSSWTYMFIINQSGCIALNALEVSSEVYEQDSAIVKIAVPWLEPVAALDGIMATNDPHFAEAWHIKNTGQCLGALPVNNGTPDADCNIEEAWNAGYTGEGIVIAVIDKGIFQNNHPDLVSQYIDGYDWIQNDSDVSMTSGPTSKELPHGQACAGLIVAVADNGIGTVGVAYDAQVIPLISWLGNSEVAFQDACVKGADIISVSWSWIGNDPAIANDIELCKTLGRNGKGIITVCSAGNTNVPSSALSFFPANLTSTIGVIASNPDDNRKTKSDGWDTTVTAEWGSNFGGAYSVAAPGTHYITTDLIGNSGYNDIEKPYANDSALYYNYCTNSILDNNYTYFSGTSGAAPITAGVCALILQSDTNYTATQVQDILQNTADKVGADTSGNPYNYNIWVGKSLQMGYGRINAFSAVTHIVSTPNMDNIIFRAYPNPATDKTTLEFSMTEPQDATIELYDYTGRKMATLYEGHNRSVQSINFKTKGLSNGMYIIILKTKTITKTLKLTVAK